MDELMSASSPLSTSSDESRTLRERYDGLRDSWDHLILERPGEVGKYFEDAISYLISWGCDCQVDSGGLDEINDTPIGFEIQNCLDGLLEITEELQIKSSLTSLDLNEASIEINDLMKNLRETTIAIRMSNAVLETKTASSGRLQELASHIESIADEYTPQSFNLFGYDRWTVNSYETEVTDFGARSSVSSSGGPRKEKRALNSYDSASLTEDAVDRTSIYSHGTMETDFSGGRSIFSNRSRLTGLTSMTSLESASLADNIGDLRVNADIVLEILLQDEPDSSERRLTVRLAKPASASRLELTYSSEVKPGTRRQTFTQDLPLDLQKLTLTPVYALPGARPDALTIAVNLQSSYEDDLTLSFRTLQHAHQFQHALTGYYVAFDKANVETQCYFSQLMGRQKRVYEKGHLQVWFHKRMQPEEQTASAEVVSRAVHPHNQIGQSRRSVSKSSTRGALESAKPKPPILVFYLHDNKGRLSLLAAQLDKRTFINRDACDCIEQDSECCLSSLETTGNNINAWRYSTSYKDDKLNVAVLGEYQQDRSNNVVLEKGIKWILIAFESVKDRVEFAGSFCHCSEGSDAQPTSQCIQKEHRGIVGLAKASYLQASNV